MSTELGFFCSQYIGHWNSWRVTAQSSLGHLSVFISSVYEFPNWFCGQSLLLDQRECFLIFAARQSVPKMHFLT